MIVVRLMGGLGNQMFQYAAGRRLARRHGTVLKLDLSAFGGRREGGTPREFALEPLAIRAEIASAPEVAALTGRGRGVLGAAVRLLRALGLRPAAASVFEERRFGFDPALLAASDGLYLSGYFQSEKYFKDIEGILREELGVRRPPDGRNLAAADAIRAGNSASLHIRRGDYVTSPATRATHGALGTEYYRACAAHLGDRVPDLRLFVFSDDPAWAKRELALPFPTTAVDWNGPAAAHEDLRLMSLCRHHVIANSSLSWWGAWLGGNPGRIVLAPKAWFSRPDLATDDLLPASWVRM